MKFAAYVLVSISNFCAVAWKVLQDKLSAYGAYICQINPSNIPPKLLKDIEASEHLSGLVARGSCYGIFFREKITVKGITDFIVDITALVDPIIFYYEDRCYTLNELQMLRVTNFLMPSSISDLIKEVVTAVLNVLMQIIRFPMIAIDYVLFNYRINQLNLSIKLINNVKISLLASISKNKNNDV